MVIHLWAQLLGSLGWIGDHFRNPLFYNGTCQNFEVKSCYNMSIFAAEKVTN